MVTTASATMTMSRLIASTRRSLASIMDMTRIAGLLKVGFKGFVIILFLDCFSVIMIDGLIKGMDCFEVSFIQYDGDGGSAKIIHNRISLHLVINDKLVESIMCFHSTIEMGDVP